jgi:hypothetical protein
VGLNVVLFSRLYGGQSRLFQVVLLDAEDLVEVGIARAYQSMLHVLGRYVSDPAQIEEVFDNNAPSYIVRCGDNKYVIYSPALPDDEGQSWGRAAHAFFRVVNDQLTKSEYRLYALNGGNDLSGNFLTEPECEAARRSLPNKEDWPYLPTSEHPRYGQYHK